MLVAPFIALVAQAAPPTAVPPPPLGRLGDRAARISVEEDAGQRVFDNFVAAMFAAPPDPIYQRAQADFLRIRESVREIAHREPFDTAALRKAYRALGEAKGRMEARRNEIVAERLGALPEAERALVMGRIPELVTVRDGAAASQK